MNRNIWLPFVIMCNVTWFNINQPSYQLIQVQCVSGIGHQRSATIFDFLFCDHCRYGVIKHGAAWTGHQSIKSPIKLKWLLLDFGRETIQQRRNPCKKTISGIKTRCFYCEVIVQKHKPTGKDSRESYKDCWLHFSKTSNDKITDLWLSRSSV